MVKIPGLPTEATTVRVVQTDEPNESVDADARAGKSKVTGLSDGPKIGPAGNYLPARYIDPNTGCIVEDR